METENITSWEGEELPAIGQQVLFKMGPACLWTLFQVTGYRVVECSDGGPAPYQLFVQGAEVGTGVESERPFYDVRIFIQGE